MFQRGGGVVEKSPGCGRKTHSGYSAGCWPVLLVASLLALSVVGLGHGVDGECAFVVCCVCLVVRCQAADSYEIRAKLVLKFRPIWGFALFYLSCLSFLRRAHLLDGAVPS